MNLELLPRDDDPGDERVMTYDEVLRGLSRRAREGSVPALLGLERALRRMNDGGDQVTAAVERIMAQPD